MLLEGKNAVIYGGGGAIGGAVARTFAREGATVHLAGRTLDRLDQVADEIRSAGGSAETAVSRCPRRGGGRRPRRRGGGQRGGIDISFNLIGYDDVQGTPLAEMSLDDFERPIRTGIRTMFLTSRAAARHMIRQRSGVILGFGGAGDPLRDYYIGGFQVALHAVEALRRQLAAELGAARHPRRHAAHRRRARDDSGGLRREGADRRLDRGCDDARAGGDPRRCRPRGRLRRFGPGPHHHGDKHQHHRRCVRRLASRRTGGEHDDRT